MSSKTPPDIRDKPSDVAVYATVLSVFLKNFLIFLAVMTVVAAGGWLGRVAYKKATERHMLARAAESLQKKDLQKAALCLTRALQVNPLSLGASKMTAEMLESMGSPAALGWRIRVAQLQPGEARNRFAWAETALRAQDLRSVANALDGVEGQSTNTAAYHKLAGALTWALRQSSEAAWHYREAARLEPTNQVVRMNLATIEMTSTNAEAADAARLLVEQLVRNPELRTQALRRLAEDAERRHHLGDAIGYSKQLVGLASAAFGDKLGHLRLLAEATNAEYATWLKTLAIEATNSPARTYAFGRWLANAGQPTNALHWLQNLPPALLTNQPVPLLVTDCLVATKDWQALLGFLAGQDWSEAEYYRLALEVLAQKSLGRDSAADANWRKAARLCAHRLDRLTRLSQVTSAWGWNLEQTQILRALAAEFPRERWAENELVTKLYRAGETRELGEVLARAYANHPADNLLKNNLASLLLLKGSDLDKAHTLAREAFETSPGNPFCASTYAYSLLLQNRPDEALKALSGLNPESLKIPSVAAYYGVVQARTGHQELAEEPLQRAEKAKLLPEELEIVRRAKTMVR
jgi:predicted Zn-dependent protease